MGKDFDLNLGSLQRFHRILPEVTSQTAKAAAAPPGASSFVNFFCSRNDDREGRTVSHSLLLWNRLLL